MYGWLIYDAEGRARNGWFIGQMVQYASSCGVCLEVVGAEAFCFGVRNGRCFAEPFEGTSDVALGAPDAHFYLYSDQKDQSFAWPMWIKMNQIVLGASKNIEAIKLLEKEPTEQFRLDELKRLK